jgi:hypothetical protein
MLPNVFHVLPRNQQFTFISVANTTSNINHAWFSSEHLHVVSVLNDCLCSDHNPINVSIPVSSSQRASLRSKWFVRKSWALTDVGLFQKVCDDILTKIKVPYHLLQSSSAVMDEPGLLNLYCEQIKYAIRCADHAAVPVSKSRVKTEKYGWSRNPILVSACSQAKVWLRIWQECDRLRVGVVNAVRIYTKRKFCKALRDHVANIKAELAAKIADDPNLLWKCRPGRFTVFSALEIPGSEWVAHFLPSLKPLIVRRLKS